MVNLLNHLPYIIFSCVCLLLNDLYWTLHLEEVYMIMTCGHLFQRLFLLCCFKMQMFRFLDCVKSSWVSASVWWFLSKIPDHCPKGLCFSQCCCWGFHGYVETLLPFISHFFFPSPSAVGPSAHRLQYQSDPSPLSRRSARSGSGWTRWIWAATRTTSPPRGTATWSLWHEWQYSKWLNKTLISVNFHFLFQRTNGENDGRRAAGVRNT